MKDMKDMKNMPLLKSKVNKMIDLVCHFLDGEGFICSSSPENQEIKTIQLRR